MKIGKENRIEALQDEIERGLTLLGVTALEDRLQDGTIDKKQIYRSIHAFSSLCDTVIDFTPLSFCDVI